MPSKHKKLKVAEPNITKDKEEKDLEEFLFGNLDSDVWQKAGHELDEETKASTVQEGQDAETEEESASDEPVFFFDNGPGFVIDAEPTPVTAEDEADSDEDMAEGSDDENAKEGEDDEEHNQEEMQKEKFLGYLQAPAWTDDDDGRLQISLQGAQRLKKLRKSEEEDIVSGQEYERRLRQQFARIYPRPAWAKLPSEKKLESKKRKAEAGEYEDSDASDQSDDDQLDEEERIDLLKSTYGILERRGTRQLLSSKHIDMIRMKNANQMAPTKGPIMSLGFHPNAQVMMTGGLDKTLRLFQVDGRVNPKIQSMRFKDLPIYTAAFHTSGDQIVLSGRRKHYYIYDVQSGAVDKCPGIWGRDEKSLEKFSISPCGKYIAFLGNSGHIILVSYLTKQWIANLKMNGTVVSADWSSDGRYLFGIGSLGEVYQWDVGQRECVKRWQDDGSLRPHIIRVSRNDKFFATGSPSGIVNLYDQSVLQSDITRPKPIKAIGNLTTTVSDIQFNHDSQLMAISSARKRNSFKLVHLPSATVFSNWPTDRTPLGAVTASAFSPNSDYLALGNRQGRVVLYGIKHYTLQQ